MSSKSSKYPYFLAIIFGLVAFFLTATEPFSIPLVLVFLFGGGLLGFLWPDESWHWGLWMAGSILALLSLSVLFAGQVDIFLKKDLPPLLLAIASGCIGGLISARYKRRQKAGR